MNHQGRPVTGRCPVTGPVTGRV